MQICATLICEMSLLSVLVYLKHRHGAQKLLIKIVPLNVSCLLGFGDIILIFRITNLRSDARNCDARPFSARKGNARFCACYTFPRFHQ